MKQEMSAIVLCIFKAGTLIIPAFIASYYLAAVLLVDIMFHVYEKLPGFNVLDRMPLNLC